MFLKDKYKLRTATGELVPVKGTSNISFELGGKPFVHEFLVASITDECILGIDFMRQHEISLNMKGGTLKQGTTEIPLHYGSTEDKDTCVRVMRNETIPAHSESIIWGRLQDNNLRASIGTIETDQMASDQGILIGRTLVKLDTDRVPVRIMNLSDQEQQLKAGTPIALCRGVEHILTSKGNESVAKIVEGNSISGPLMSNLLEDLSKTLQGEAYQKAKNLIIDFQDVMAEHDGPLGRTNLVQHQINTAGARPIRQIPRRLPLATRVDATEMIKEMQNQGIIEPSNSPWSSPVVLVKKKDGSLRFCVDYRRLNEVTLKDSYPLPRIDDTLDTLSGSQIFSTLDLKSGYWQVEIHPDDKEKTAFSTGEGLWQFTVMPFGLCNAPATFERLMEQILNGLNWRTCLVYLDDIIVTGKTFDEHLDNLREVFERIRNAGMKLSPKKCSLFKKEVKYLGHIVSSSGISTDPEKLETVTNWPIPNNLQELRSFLGLCTYYRRFVANFSDIARALHELTEKGKPFLWTTQCQQAFDSLKEAVTTAPILAYPVPGAPFILDTDASNSGIGAVLSQGTENGEKVVAFYSRSLSKTERNYCVTRRELLAAVESIRQFQKYLYGQPFLLRTDHASLRWLLNFKNPEGQMARWIEKLQNYEFQIEHRKGQLHSNADALSRRPCQLYCKHCSLAEKKQGIEVCQQMRVTIPQAWTEHGVREEQMKDEDIAPIFEWMERGVKPQWQQIAKHGEITKSYWAQWDSLATQRGVLYRKWETEDGENFHLQLILPKTRVKEVLEEIHNGISGGHLGVNKTMEKVRQRFYWLRYKHDVEEWCRRCEVCAECKGPQRKTKGLMQLYNVGVPFERIALDVAGPFPITKNGNRYILVIADYFTKWTEAIALPNQEAETIVETLINIWVSRFGVPLELHSDQGRNFESKIFQELCQSLGIHKTRTTALHPQSDGMVERFNRTMEQHLSKMVGEQQDDWDKYLQLFLMAYRGAVHSTTGVSPAKMTFGREIRLPADIAFGKPEEPKQTMPNYMSKFEEKMATIHRTARQNIGIISDQSKARYDRQTNAISFKEGDQVWFYNPQRKKGRSPKLQRDWEGPYRVVKKINDVVYRIQKGPRLKMKVVHSNRLAKYNGEDAESVQDEQI